MSIPYEISCKEEQLRLFTFHFWLVGNILKIVSFEVVHDSLELEIDSDGHVVLVFVVLILDCTSVEFTISTFPNFGFSLFTH